MSRGSSVNFSDFETILEGYEPTRGPLSPARERSSRARPLLEDPRAGPGGAVTPPTVQGHATVR